ncbi:MAG: hypothetical protein B7Y40_04630 [Gammaproteobacteria bacterium 28-57-27]|nr:MAG: hypothetical protein B7Y40_04630 [Gammaproteobacteria bacterium 28-57-27]
MQQAISHERRAALLSELGIVLWRARPGQVFPGAGALDISASEPVCVPDSMVTSPEAPESVGVDMLIYADTHTAAEAELLARIIQAVHGLRAGLHIEQHALDAAAHATGLVSLRLNDLDLPSPASMLANPASKRRLWLALQDAVARLP